MEVASRSGVNTVSTAGTVTIKSVSLSTGPVIDNPHWPFLSFALVFVGDFAALWLILRISLKDQVIATQHADSWLHLWPLLTLFLIFFGVCGIYPGISVGPVDDIKRISTANLGAFLFVSFVLALNGAPLRMHFMWLLTCTCSAFVLATVRNVVRRIGSRFDWWGYPVALFGCGDTVLSVLRKLKSQPQLGLRPVAIIMVDNCISERQIDGVAVCSFEHLDRITSSGVKHAIVAAPELSQSEFADVLECGGNAFPHMIIIPDNHFVWKLGSHTRDLMGVMGIQVGNNLLRVESRAAKRAIDLILCVLLTPFLLVLTAIIAALIALESGFPVFYSQKRVGHDGRSFHIWKFRTMAQDAADVLERTLATDPALRREWMANHKLRNDPRITRVGKILRRTSLDEIPQLWNVIQGEMSLVGPRPIVEEEIAKYNEAYSWYSKTVPGVTGLWQVSGRSRTSYAERVAYDTYYVRNWSVWMDIYLLAKTFTVIFTGDGAS